MARFSGHAVLLTTCLVIALGGCSRALTPNERAFAADILGPSLDADKVRVAQDMGFAAPPTKSHRVPRSLPVDSPPHEGACDRTAPQAASGPPPAWALFNRVHFVTDLYQPDLAAGWPQYALFPQALVMAHELVHVWQWQNRRRTHYHPVRAALESLVNLDPYFYAPKDGTAFLEYGYEQQAALLEDYLCYALYDPANARRAHLRTILSPYFPLDRLDASLAR
ncbi:hypothetical protein G5B38_01405 [Pseudohalocynthiibacter aestuariivivens]|nr:hypothetical protein [Pseudohalocynthiibacter aestuariivivens]QIE44296.1 hypothetical protein G5B38_01405 [Pseudohalocynthiibacter aestuariivivens]